jgi:hypothetical protein
MPHGNRRCGAALAAVIVALASPARAQPDAAQRPPPAPAAPAGVAPATTAGVEAAAAPAAPAPPPPPTDAASGATVGPFTVTGYVEGHYAYNFNKPSNGITNWRWLDNRHNTFQLSTAVVDFLATQGPVVAHVALQAGPVADGWYSDSVEGRAGASGAAPVGASTWKHIQQAYAGWKAPIGRGLMLQAGLFLTQVGIEGPAVKDNFNWSRSNLFLVLPFYHAGVRATYEFTEQLSFMVMGYNGWNLATDNNAGKTVAGQLIFKVPERLTMSVLYMGGPERATGSPEGEPWRHLLDAWAQLDLGSIVSLALHGNAGFEQGAFGTQQWRAAAAYVRLHPVGWLYIAARGDAFDETTPSNSAGQASSLFFPASDVYSATGTLDFRPAETLSFRTEFRHDQASNVMFFKGDSTDAAGAQVENARQQDTLSFGLTAWF